MKLELNIEKRYAYIIIGLLIVLIGVLVVGAYTTAIPNPGHGGDAVLVKVGGTEKTLQAAIDAGELSGGGAAANVKIGSCILAPGSVAYGNNNPPTQQDVGSWWGCKDAVCPEDYPFMMSVAFDVHNFEEKEGDTNGYRVTCCQLLVNGQPIKYTLPFTNKPCPA